MSRTKIDYGIDLGTTNSAIARMEKGVPVIKKSTRGTQTDTTPSCVSFNKKEEIRVGKPAYRALASERVLAFKKNDHTLVNSFEEFKRTMGTDTQYECKNMEKSYLSEDLSGEVLKTLKGYVRDEELESVVVTVPAKFEGFQDDATKKATELAGFKHCILLQEPIAASMAYGINAETIDGMWLVFDFGGGTFDVALMQATDGIMKVKDTQGDNKLGGKNIDESIVDKIILPHLFKEFKLDSTSKTNDKLNLLKNAVKREAESIKINFSPNETEKESIYTDEPIGKDDEGNDIEIDLTITREEFEETVKPIFQRAIDITNKMLKANNITSSDIKTILMIGGPTQSDTFREMIKGQISENINISIDPMTAVATGAALFASTKAIPEAIKKIDKSKIQLKLSYQSDTVEIDEKVGIKVLRDKTDGDVPEKLFVSIERDDKGWASGKIELKDDRGILELLLIENKPNGFEIILTDDKGTSYPCEPDSFSIIHGFKVAGAVLQADLCVDAFEMSKGKRHLVPLKGLKKNQLLPSKGTRIFQTLEDIRPGNKLDIIKIPIYEGDPGTKGIYNNYRGEVVITGDQLQGFLPQGSEVELKIDCDESRGIKVSAMFPYLDDFIIDGVIKTGRKKVVPKKYLEEWISNGHSTISKIRDETEGSNLVSLQEIEQTLDEQAKILKSAGDDGTTRDQIFDRLREALKLLDEIEAITEWPKVMNGLKNSIENLERTQEQFGDDNTAKILQQYKEKIQSVQNKQDIKVANDLIEEIDGINFVIIDQGAGVALEISMIKGFDDNFDIHDWKSNSDARRLINEAKSIINTNNPTKEKLRPIVMQLYDLLPSAKDIIGKGPGEVLGT